MTIPQSWREAFKRREGRTPNPMKKGRARTTPHKKTQKKNATGQFPLLVKKFHEE
jgi:hypothetical protein